METLLSFIKNEVVPSFVNPSKRIQVIKQEIETKKACCEQLKASHPNLTPAQLRLIRELEEEIETFTYQMRLIRLGIQQGSSKEDWLWVKPLAGLIITKKVIKKGEDKA